MVDDQAGDPAGAGPVSGGRRARDRVRTLALLAGGALVACALVWTLGPGGPWVLEHLDGVEVGGRDGLKGKELADALDAVRGRALTVGTGLLAAAAIYYTASNATSARRSADAAHHTAQAAQRSAEATEHGQRRTLELTEQSMVTGRYTAAIEQLGSDKADIRLGGIYALERIARDSTRDHPTVMAVLAAFVREHSQDPDAHVPIPRRPEQPAEAPERHRLRTDLKAALVVIGRRDHEHDRDRIDLMAAELSQIRLTGANLCRANLNRADLSYARLRDTDFSETNLTKADLSRADLRGANLTGADLTGADLRGADLTGSVGATAEALREMARTDEHTRLPTAGDRAS
ncbi:pentapeptide repeat-containing protein [Actinomadura alba]|uniref:Pentapeptide repeat-containing protein n=1 Tax=Actinomadura alba TaxID=406431 RepID=A0ABR7LS61_9ACTN|nr:pentapeptide repeat-containing protein [Actinomadura alba]MBC6467429.1 pentapeptide repeat-containing protein [Actinomadura alba]